MARRLFNAVDQRLMVETLVEAEQRLVQIKKDVMDPAKTKSERDSLIRPPKN